MNISDRIARDRRADRINELYKRCHARFLQVAFAHRLANERIAPLTSSDPAYQPLSDLLDRATRAMAILNARSIALGRAYVSTLIPREVRNA